MPIVEPLAAYFASPPRCPSSSAPRWRSEQPIMPSVGAKVASIGVGADSVTVDSRCGGVGDAVAAWPRQLFALTFPMGRAIALTGTATDTRRLHAPLLRLLLDQLRDQAGPAGLVAGAEAGAVVAVEVLVEEQVVAPVRIVLERRLAAEHRAAALAVAREEADQALRELVGDLRRA